MQETNCIFILIAMIIWMILGFLLFLIIRKRYGPHWSDFFFLPLSLFYGGIFLPFYALGKTHSLK